MRQFSGSRSSPFRPNSMIKAVTGRRPSALLSDVRIYALRSRYVGFRTGFVPNSLLIETSIQKRVGVVWIEPDGLVVVGDGAYVVIFTFVGQGSVVKGDSQVFFLLCSRLNKGGTIFKLLIPVNIGISSTTPPKWRKLCVDANCRGRKHEDC